MRNRAFRSQARAGTRLTVFANACKKSDAHSESIPKTKSIRQGASLPSFEAAITGTMKNIQ
jgi:hypothetical protein